MFEIIGEVFTIYGFVFGICIGAVLSTGCCLLAIYLDHKQMIEIARRRTYDSMSLLFSDSYWDQKLALEIVLPEVL